MLKENLKEFPPLGCDPYITLQAKREDQLLPAIAGKLKLSRIDGNYGDPFRVPTNNQMLFNTGAHHRYIMENMLQDGFLRYLKEDEKNKVLQSSKVHGLFTF